MWPIVKRWLDRQGVARTEDLIAVNQKLDRESAFHLSKLATAQKVAQEALDATRGMNLVEWLRRLQKLDNGRVLERLDALEQRSPPDSHRMGQLTAISATQSQRIAALESQRLSLLEEFENLKLSQATLAAALESLQPPSDFPTDPPLEQSLAEHRALLQGIRTDLHHGHRVELEGAEAEAVLSLLNEHLESPQGPTTGKTS